MSWTTSTPADCSEGAQKSLIDVIIDGRSRPIDEDFTVRRVLPAIKRRHVGPFVFFDHIGPTHLAPGHGMDVRPHPHIHLATITYLFEGAIFHRDSLGSEQVIVPGDLNWMTAGSGIVHSERSPEDQRAQDCQLHGLQIWIALPRAQQDTAPEFRHYPQHTLPALSQKGVQLRVLVGSAYGLQSPVTTFSPTLYVEALMDAGSSLLVPNAEERAVYLVDGAISLMNEEHTGGRMVVLAPGASVTLQARKATRLVIIGGAPVDGERHMWWNFVSSSRERIEQAKQDWKEGRFPKVPGDEEEFIPLPDR